MNTRRIYHTFLLLLLIAASACNFNKKEDCIKLDNDIAGINDSLLQMGAHWGEELKIAINTLDFSQLPPARIRMQEFIDKKIDHVKGLKNVGGSEELVKTQLEFLTVEKDIIQTRLAAFEQFDSTVIMDELKATYAQMQIGAAREQELLAKLHTLREQYAEKNDIPKFIEKH